MTDAEVVSLVSVLLARATEAQDRGAFMLAASLYQAAASCQCALRLSQIAEAIENAA